MMAGLWTMDERQMNDGWVVDEIWIDGFRMMVE
jgi:hypothetical protein